MFRCCRWLLVTDHPAVGAGVDDGDVSQFDSNSPRPHPGHPRPGLFALAILSICSLSGPGGEAGVGWSSDFELGRDCMRMDLSAGMSGMEDGIPKTSEITAVSCGWGCGELLDLGFGHKGLRGGCCCSAWLGGWKTWNRRGETQEREVKKIKKYF
jgi:hypothetical protein